MANPPTDVMGNPLSIGNVVTFFPGQPIIGKIVNVQNGGIQTAQGPTPSMIRLVIDIQLAGPPEARYTQVVRAVSPSSEEVVSKILQDTKMPKV